MREDIQFTLEELDKINLVHYIQSLFFEYNELYLINICIHKSSVIEKGKKVDVKKTIKPSITFRYQSFYCAWFNGGAYIAEEYEKLFDCQNNNLTKIIQNFNPIHFYLQINNKKITYNDFEEKIINVKELQEEKIPNIFGEANFIRFCRDSFESDSDNFLGLKILSKKYAQNLNKTLIVNSKKEKWIKV